MNNNSLFPTRHSADSDDVFHCVKCGCVLRENKQNKGVIKKHKILFNGRYCIPCSNEVEREVSNIVANYFNLKLGYYKIVNILNHILKIYDLNNESDLFFYLDNIKKYILSQENAEEINKLLSL